MAWESGFFNSVNGDRVYNADKFNEIFEGLLSNGVFQNVGGMLKVEPNSGMVIQVDTGRGWFNNHWIRNTSEKLITLEGSDNVLNRYAAIVVRVDESTAVRDVSCTVKYSSFDSSPEKPTMVRSELVNEYCLAYVYIPAKATAIRVVDIEDTRPNTELCGWVTGLVDQLDFNGLYTQFKAMFDEWFNGLVDTLDENTEAMLVNAMPKSVVVTLAANSWTGSEGNYRQTVSVTSMNSTKTVIVQPESDSEAEYTEAEVEAVEQGTNTLTFKAKIQPSSSLNVKVMHTGV